MNTKVSDGVYVKGTRLARDGRVFFAVEWEGTSYWTVAGDNGMYLVGITQIPYAGSTEKATVGWSCTCPATVTCSHITAALIEGNHLD